MSKDQFTIPPLVIQSGEHYRFEAADIDDLREAVKLWREEIHPFLCADVDRTMPANPDAAAFGYTPRGGNRDSGWRGLQLRASSEAARASTEGRAGAVGCGHGHQWN